MISGLHSASIPRLLAQLNELLWSAHAALHGWDDGVLFTAFKASNEVRVKKARETGITFQSAPTTPPLSTMPFLA